MNFDSPSNVVKNIENFFGSNSPDSPSFLPKSMTASKHLKKLSRPKPSLPLKPKNLNTLIDHTSSLNYDSPTSTLAADLSENFHIEENSAKTIPTPKRSLVFNQPELLDGITLDSEQRSPIHEDESPLMSRQPQPQLQHHRQPLRPSLLQHESSKDSSRTTSNASISSLTSISSISSSESANCTSATSSTFLKPRTLRRAQTTISGSMRLFHSLSASTIDLSRPARFAPSDDEDGYSSDELMTKLDSNNTATNLNLDDLDDHRTSFLKFDHDDDDDDALDKLCVPSPIAERSFEGSASRTGHVIAGLNKRDCGSPLQKKPIRSKVRRTHSMFYSQKEITDTTNMFGNLMGSPKSNDITLNEEPGATLSNSMIEKAKIEFFHVKNDSIPRITPDTLCKILDGHYKEFFSDVVVVDCRFEYEYKGGHINGAVNVSSQQELEDRFLQNRTKNTFASGSKKSLIIFHCEFSSYRGPLMASHLRTCDRNINQDNYPHLDYPDILILEGGYKSFFDRQPSRCYPQKYVEMNDNKHKNDCEKELTRFRRDLKRASSFNSLSYPSSVATSSRSHHRRTATSASITFARRSSLKAHTLDFSRSSIEELTHRSNSSTDSTTEKKPPASLDFAFKFPKEPSSSISTNPLSPSDTHSVDNIQPSVLVRKKLSRSFTVNM